MAVPLNSKLETQTLKNRISNASAPNKGEGCRPNCWANKQLKKEAPS